ncbi:LysM peptidoglycan-binding domain-containing protein [Micromonospora sp. DR5-3]|uniref:BTAD domain-containing putative transcriptional regulator n=1 Tax=unclassified Micromonospora TaxID=2617518 RepID=UPI0016521DDA|nr:MULTISPECIES: BTAD domain-containing putative transcriptional regulator [unclassified Micromonospora]MCW3820370.1 LysM peptidoglycan-binding domain-containing protein [Micromonospora sp. DR5-3]
MTSRTARTAAITTVLSTAAIPVVLAMSGAWAPELPSPAALRDWIAQPMSTGFVIALTVAAGVALWLLLATAVLTHAYAALARRLRWTPTLRLPGPVQGLAAALLGATAVTTATGVAAHANPVTSSGDLPAAEPAAGTPTPHQLNPDPPDVEHKPTYTVRRGDSLCRIAERTLGDGDRWPEIFALNRGTHFPGVGGTLRDPNVIYPGWTLALPADAIPPSRPHPPKGPAPQEPGPDKQAVPDPGDAAPSRPAPAATQQAAAPESAAATALDSSAAAARTSTGEAVSPTAYDSGPDEKGSRGVWLSSGSWVELGLALAIVAAVALVWAHRQRRYVPRPPAARPRFDDPTLAPMPRVVGQIRRGLRRATPATADRRSVSSAGESYDQGPDHAVPADVGDTAAGGLLPVVPMLSNPLSPRWPGAGLGLTGPGAAAAARGFLTAALAAGGVDHPEARTHVVMPSATAAGLLSDTAVNPPRTPRLTITADLNEALEILETLAMHRTRLLHQHDVDTVTELRAADPYEEPLPPLMLLADATSRCERARVAALLTQGQRLDIHGVFLGEWPDGDTVNVADDGTTSPADGDLREGTHIADVGRLTVLDPAETADLLATLAESHTGQPQHPVTADPPPPTPVDTSSPLIAGDTAHSPRLSATITGRRVTDTAAKDTTQTDDADAAAGPADADEGVSPAPDPNPDAAHRAAEAAAASGQAAPARAADAPEGGTRVRVRVLSAPGVVGGDPQRKPRAKSLELLVYLAVHDGAASTEAILDDLLPDAPSRKAPGRLYTYVSGLRAVLRAAAGAGGHVTHPDHRYLLNRDLLDVDLWRMRAAIRDAAQTTDPQTRAAALRRAVDAYTGPLAEGCDYEWVEPYRQAIRQEALDASLALADALTGQPAQQLAVLDAAITHNPHHEALYQAAMRVRAELGDVGGIRSLRRALTRRLGEIDAEPSDETLALADRLITGLSRHGTVSGSRSPNREGAAK